MSEITPFIFPTTGQTVRTVTVDGEPWFVATDVTDILGYVNGRDAASRLPERMRNTVALADGTPGNPNRTIISEPGVYRLAMRSTLLSAEAFQDWLAEDVVPSIRKTGSYSLPRELTRLELIDMARDSELGRIEAENRALAAEHQMLELAPAAHAWDVLASANGDYSVGDAAKILSRDPAIKTGQQRLFTTMRAYGWTYRGADGRWRAKQSAVEIGRLTELPSSHYHPRTGELVLDPPTVRVLAKGLAELHKRMGGAGDVRDLIEQPVSA